MKHMSFFVCSLSLFCGQMTLAQKENSKELIVTVGANPLITKSFNDWTAKEPCDNVASYQSPLANRGTVELMLACRALKLKMPEAKLVIMQTPEYERALKEALSGRNTMPAETLWEIDIDKQAFYATDPIIRDGDFEKGIYVSSDNAKVLQVKSLEDLRAFSAVMPKAWRVDYATLEKMGVTKIEDTSTKESMFKMIKSKRVDFTLLEFSAEKDFANKLADTVLVPIPGVKISLKGWRSLVVSKKAPNGEKVFNALNDGIKQLRADGIIEKAFTESGFFNKDVKDWKKIF